MELGKTLKVENVVDREVTAEARFVEPAGAELTVKAAAETVDA